MGAIPISEHPAHLLKEHVDGQGYHAAPLLWNKILSITQQNKKQNKNRRDCMLNKLNLKIETSSKQKQERRKSNNLTQKIKTNFLTSHISLKLLLGMNINGLVHQGWMPLHGFWQMGSVVHRFYWLKASTKRSYLERFPTLSKNKSLTKALSIFFIGTHHSII